MVFHIKNNTILIKKNFKAIKEHIEAFQQTREAHRHELIDDYVELINYLKKTLDIIRQIDIAIYLGVAQPTVAKMLRRLFEAGLIKKMSYRGIFLTDKGKKLAIKNHKRHVIVKKFLLSLGIDLKTAQLDAEGIEHHVSDNTLLAFQKFYKNREKIL
ncbi:manganese-binding transcriptional regulator MntR [Candidatus Tachikawaea gelatinosa]|uniref:Transcriptional regulator MntR n=1 Tax=Candidatus Tachikawaea gelatinosa TaxID=1410383 RepID=A0A090ARC7_9ENTR|nr:manganese-binding transcriptional regulator MntR [Candidatus Tachikawaea gelatinosa]BAP58310.1 transcriptional regulator MntR [Candidatus Tachikawaea gelatinosa]